MENHSYMNLALCMGGNINIIIENEKIMLPKLPAIKLEAQLSIISLYAVGLTFLQVELRA